jgi:hypothetical protein
MSRAKNLRENSDNNLNLYEFISLFTPDNKSKYAELLLKLMKKTPNLKSHVDEIRYRFKNEFGVNESKLNDLNELHLIMFYRILDTTFNFSDLKSFQKFCQLNERNLINQNDLSRYSSFDEIINQLSLAEINAETKDLEKQVKIIFEDDEWILVRPLTYLSSKKYGANTKWCTTQYNNPEYFIKYSTKGVLIYCINKKTGYKVASFYSLDRENPEFSFWNQKDSRIDSLDTELTESLKKIIFTESKDINAKTNRFLLSDDERMKEDLILETLRENDVMLRPVEATMDVNVEAPMNEIASPDMDIHEQTELN